MPGASSLPRYTRVSSVDLGHRSCRDSLMVPCDFARTLSLFLGG